MNEVAVTVASWHWVLAVVGLLLGAAGGFLLARRLPTPPVAGIQAEMVAGAIFIYLLVFENLPFLPAGLPILGSLAGSLVGLLLRFRELKQ